VAVVAQHGEVVAEAASGLADRTTGRKISGRTRFATASVTKMFTAAAIARLADRGLVDFDATVRDLLPSEWCPPALDAGVGNGLHPESSTLPARSARRLKTAVNFRRWLSGAR
jgi:CubicO group peptidase (beta-lactamase class C family)